MPQRRVPAPLDGPDAQVSDPHVLLTEYLEWYRDALVRKLDGLSEEQLRTPVKPLGWAPLGLVQHLTWVERRWMRWGFAAENTAAYPAGGDDEEWTVEPSQTVTSVLDAFRAEVENSRALMAGAAMSTRAGVGGRFSSEAEAPTLGRILFHLFQEYARHVGQLDIARELIDGSTGE